MTEKAYWSDDEAVFFLEGKAYGFAGYIGTEEEVLKEHPATNQKPHSKPIKRKSRRVKG